MSWIQLLCIGFNLCIYQSKLEAKAKSYFPSSLLCPTCLNQWYRNPCIVHCFLLSTVKRVFIESAQLCLLLIIINWCIEWMNETDNWFSLWLFLFRNQHSMHFPVTLCHSDAVTCAPKSWIKFFKNSFMFLSPSLPKQISL